jgi:hypothetical protein
MPVRKPQIRARSKTKAAARRESRPEKPGLLVGPGEYLPDPSEGITRPEALPPPKRIRIERNFKQQACPRCGHLAYRDRVYTRRLHDVGDLDAGRPRDLEILYSQHCCSRCRKYFHADTSDLAPPFSHYTHRVISLAVRTVVEDGLPYQPASWRLWRDFRVFVPWATIQNWVEAGGEKGGRAP